MAKTAKQVETTVVETKEEQTPQAETTETAPTNETQAPGEIEGEVQEPQNEVITDKDQEGSGDEESLAKIASEYKHVEVNPDEFVTNLMNYINLEFYGMKKLQVINKIEFALKSEKAKL